MDVVYQDQACSRAWQKTLLDVSTLATWIEYLLQNDSPIILSKLKHKKINWKIYFDKIYAIKNPHKNQFLKMSCNVFQHEAPGISQVKMYTSTFLCLYFQTAQIHLFFQCYIFPQIKECVSVSHKYVSHNDIFRQGDMKKGKNGNNAKRTRTLSALQGL